MAGPAPMAVCSTMMIETFEPTWYPSISPEPAPAAMPAMEAGLCMHDLRLHFSVLARTAGIGASHSSVNGTAEPYHSWIRARRITFHDLSLIHISEPTRPY